MEHKVYSQEPITDKDKLVTEELKKFASEVPVGPAGRYYEEEVMTRASSEIEKRTKRVMLYQNVDYFTASNRVVQADKELAMLWTHGYVKE